MEKDGMNRVEDQESTKYRAQSETVGLILLLGITFISIGVIILLAQPTVSDATQGATLDRVQNDLVRLDSRFSAASLGTSNNESLRLDLGDGDLLSRSNTTFMNVTLNNRVLFNGSIGSIEYSNGDGTIAYEGGGVWLRGITGSSMISPPDIDFDGESLTLPIYNVTTDVGFGGTAVVSVGGGNNTRHFPNSTAGLRNPVNETDTVNITVESEYYEAWARYFEEELGANVTVDDENERVKAEIVPPEAPNQLRWAGVSEKEYSPPRNDPFRSFRDGATFPSVDRLISSYVEYTESNNGTSQVGNLSVCRTVTCDNTRAPVQYNSTGQNYTMDGEKFDISSTNITVVVDGDLTIKSMEVTNSAPKNSLTVVATGDVRLANGYNVKIPSGAELDSAVFHARSNSEVIFNSSGGTGASGNGTIYAPDSLVSLSDMGNSRWKGSIVAETINADGVSSGAEVFLGGSSPVDVRQVNATTNLYVTEKRVGISIGG